MNLVANPDDQAEIGEVKTFQGSNISLAEAMVDNLRRQESLTAADSVDCRTTHET